MARPEAPDNHEPALCLLHKEQGCREVFLSFIILKIILCLSSQLHRIGTTTYYFVLYNIIATS